MAVSGRPVPGIVGVLAVVGGIMIDPVMLGSASLSAVVPSSAVVIIPSWPLVVLVWDFIVGMIVRIFVAIISIIAVIFVLLFRSMFRVPCVVFWLSFLEFGCMIFIWLVRVDVILRDWHVGIVLRGTVSFDIST